MTGETDRNRTAADLVELPARWRTLVELTSGRHVQVWVAEDLELERQVVLKVFPAFRDAAVRARALLEISLGQRLRHPHLVRLYEVAEVEQHLVAVMERMAGGSLGQRLAFEGAQPLDRVVSWTQQTLKVLAYLHERKLVHRDVKPSNLLLDEHDDLKLGDLGLVGRFDRERYLPETRSSVGTQGYMAPDQVSGGEPAPSWDLYALGVTVTQLITGARPRRESSAAEATENGQAGSTGAIAESVPLWLDQFIGRLLEQRPLDRWASAREALAVFEVQRSS